jgi:hypothetical protein
MPRLAIASLEVVHFQSQPSAEERGSAQQRQGPATKGKGQPGANQILQAKMVLVVAAVGTTQFGGLLNNAPLFARLQSIFLRIAIANTRISSGPLALPLALALTRYVGPATQLILAATGTGSALVLLLAPDFGGVAFRACHAVLLQVSVSKCSEWRKKTVLSDCYKAQLEFLLLVRRRFIHRSVSSVVNPSSTEARITYFKLGFLVSLFLDQLACRRMSESHMSPCQQYLRFSLSVL